MRAVFGDRDPGAVYRDREGAYAVILDGHGNAALVEAPAANGPERGLFLLGGGIEPGETPEACIRRECLEEAGREVRVGEYLCTGEEYLFAPSDETYLHVIGRCYLARLGEQVKEPIEHDHILKWVPARDCHRMFLQYQVWAVNLAWTGGAFIMGRKERFYDQLELLIEAVNEEQNAAAQRKSRYSAGQLRLISKELVSMGRAVASEESFQPYYPRGLADLWPEPDLLGRRLMELANSYDRIQRERKLQKSHIEQSIEPLKEKEK